MQQVLATLFVASCSAYGAISTQYQAHDGLGGYSYGYSDPLSTKSEHKTADGVLHGGYSYVDANGHIQTVKYTSDSVHGFQVEATNLPKGPSPVVAAYHAAPVVGYHAPAVSHWGVASYAPLALSHNGGPLETPEVVAAKHAHFAAHAEANARLHHVGRRSAYYYNEAPAPVNGVPQDTHEVQHAKAIHFAAVAKAKAGAYSAYPTYNAPAYYSHAPAYYHSGPAHYEPAPAPINGVPQDTNEVKHAKAEHFALVAKASSGAGYHAYPAQYAPSAYHYPTISNGVPEDTYEVKAAKAKHFAAVAEAQSRAAYGYGHGGYAPSHEDDGSYKPQNYDGYYH